MSHPRRSIRWAFLLVTVALSGACGGGTGCGGCGSTTPLPAGGLPVDQTVEGGGQIRVTPSGMGKIQTLARDMVDDALGEGFCIPPTEIGDGDGTLGTGAFICQGNQNQCAPGCDTDITIDSITVGAAGTQTLRLRAQVDVIADVPTNYQVLGFGGSCTLQVTANNFIITADIALGIDGSSGEMTIGTPQVPRPNLSVSFANCGVASSLLNLFSGFFTSYIVDAIIAVVRPTLEQLVDELLPDPLGIVGMMDVGSLLSGFSSGSSGSLEARVLPGGYVHFTGNGGLSVGMITAFNADRDPATRSPELDSEVARCVPALPAPDFNAPPHSLLRTVRSSFALPAAPDFDGAPDPAGSDLAIGLSETTFDLLGHHLVTSGAACLGLGTAQVSQLSLATFAIVSPSLAELGSEDRKDPMLLVTRPTKAVDFTIGDGTEASPTLKMKLQDFEVDVYAFLYERYVRAFTMTLSLEVGLNLELEQQAGQPVTIKPVLLGISAQSVRVTVDNTELIREKKADLEAILPVVFNLVTPLLGDLPSIALPAFAGFSLQDLSIRKVTTTADSFLAVQGNLGALTLPAAQLAKLRNSALRKVAVAAPERSTGTARLTDVKVPALDEVRLAVAGRGGQLPSVTFEVDRVDALGRQLEWSWRLGDGLWRPYTSASPLVIADRAFAFQGDYTVGLMSRVAGDYRTVSREQRVAVRIDSVAPHLVTAQTRFEDGALSVTGYDAVARRELSIAFGRPGEDAPATAWTSGETAVLEAAKLAELSVGDEVVVFLRDPSGNVEQALVKPKESNFHGKASGEGCACDTGGGPSGGGLALLLATGLVLTRRRGGAGRLLRRVRAAAPQLRDAGGALATIFCISVAASLVPGCSCGGSASRACELVQDCAGYCTDGQVAFCIDGGCVCSDDIPPGKIGPYADLAVSEDGTAWVVAYAQTYGDLVAVQAKPGRVLAETWEWVDGVPEGPVVIEGARIRGGIEDEGDDVGMYPSVAITKAGQPVVSYFDRETASLRLAVRGADGKWTKHVVDAGTGTLAGAAGALVGMYTSLTLRSDDGRPGIAYLAHVKDENGTRAEVRYASAQVAEPAAAADWMIKVVDTAPVPVPTEDDPNIYPLPAGLGLFVDSARLTNQAPVVVYYDRTSGALKMSSFNPTQNRFDPPVLVDGGTNDDAGWSPTIAVDSAGKIHIAYVGAAQDDLEYIKVASPQGAPEIVDDGYRIDGETPDGLPRPVLHFVGDDASMVVTLNGTPVITYQDATSHELLVARRGAAGGWTRKTVAGDEDPFIGAYGFFATSAATSSKLYIASWVLDPSIDEQWVEIFERPLME